MKRAVIIHQTDGDPSSNWFPWLKTKFEAAGYEVWVPNLPNSHTPNRVSYAEALLGGDWDLTNNIVVGHSSGAVQVLNLLMDERCPRIQLGVMVSAWEHGVPPGMDAVQFAELFPPEGFDFATIKSKADKLMFLHAADDPYCPLEQAKYLAAQTNGSLEVLPNGGHLGAGYSELPALWRIIEPNLA